MSPLRDLTPDKDPKGGSPKTPMPIPARQYQEIEYHGSSGNGTIWKMATSLLSGLFIMSVVAYWTALQAKGVTHSDMEHYVGEFFKDKDSLISMQNASQDTEIGKLFGGEERITLRLNAIDLKLSNDEKDITDLQSKVRQFGDYLDEVRKAKR